MNYGSFFGLFVLVGIIFALLFRAHLMTSGILGIFIAIVVILIALLFGKKIISDVT
jgi:hypothetical protein